MTWREVMAEEEAQRRIDADEKAMRLYGQAMRAWWLLGVALFLMPSRRQKAERWARVTNKLFVRRKGQVMRAYLRSVGIS